MAAPLERSNVQRMVRSFVGDWEQDGTWVMPNLADALEFMTCEAAEAMDARLRFSSYRRNNKKNVEIEDIAEEIFDTVMMACIALDILGFDLIDVGYYKLEKMDRTTFRKNRDEAQD